MILAVGTDLVELTRIERSLDRYASRFLERILTCDERGYCERQGRPTASIGARFAAKEAVMKCLGTGWAEGVGFREIEVHRDDRGRPEIRLHGRASARATELGIRRWHVSLSHTDEHALAMVVAEA